MFFVVRGGVDLDITKISVVEKRVMKVEVGSRMRWMYVKGWLEER